MQCFRFNSQSRKAGETVAAYVADLRRLAEFCNYGTTLDKMLRDHLVWSINDKTEAKFLQEKDLDFQKALTIARGHETADQNLKEMKAPPADSEVKVKSVWQETYYYYCCRCYSYCDWGEWCDMPSLWHSGPQSDYMQVP
jgi:hypothetical protein